ncbi:hypothetical protein ELG84_24170 [Rhizobium leguminosarum]|nr:hypothetical protein ELG84_24170 [Rhizobium leguminosarum]
MRVIEIATGHMKGLTGHEFDLLTISKPVSAEAAVNLTKVISKLSPLLGNLIEFNTCEYLSDKPEFAGAGRWQRQDPGFPDAIFVGDVEPTPGFEIKTWFPLATELTARFKDSQNHFLDDRTYVALIAWLPEFLIYGKPYILDVSVFSGASVAKSRDDHYHNPPDYLVIEPRDTAQRTKNLQQTNTNGYKFQGTKEQFREAEELVNAWGAGGRLYSPQSNYQQMLEQLIARFPYRLDTNYAKIDRIVHPEIEAFKSRVLNTKVNGMTVRQWMRIIASEDDRYMKKALRDHLGITEVDAGQLLK